MRADAECGLRDNEIPPSHPQYRPMLEAGRKNITRIFAQRKQLQQAIFDVLKRDLPKGCDVLDLFSGEMPAIFPLLKSGHINSVTAIDNGTKSPLCHTAGQIVAAKLGVSNKIQRLPISINANTDLSRIPQIENVTMIDTGLAVPEKNRGNRLDEANAANLRVCHILDSEADFDDVLRVLEGTGRRVFHVFDAAHYRRPLKTELRDFVQGKIEKRPGWRIEKWEPVNPQSPMMHGTLIRE